MAKKFYEGESGEKRISAIFSPDRVKKVRFLQIQHELAEKDVILTAIDEMYLRSIEATAVETGMIKNPSVTLSRKDFSDDALFNSICLQADVYGPDGTVQTVQQISFEVRKAFVSEQRENNSSTKNQVPKEETF